MSNVRPTPAAALVLVLFAAWPTLASLSTVAGLFESGEYDAARESLNAGDEGVRPGEDILWRSRLATNPTQALNVLETGLKEERFPAAVRLRIALEIAEIQAGRGNHREVVDVLAPLIGGESTDLPGAVHLRAALSLRARGQLQQAREMLASIRPGDPEFVLARYYLGDIGLEQNDATLALRYFKAAAKATDDGGVSRLGAGLWRAHRATGQTQAADDLADKLMARDPGSLALLEIRRLIQVETDERRARTTDDPVDEVVTPVIDTTGRYALQLGAFSDRGLALEFVKRYRKQLPDLRIDKMRDQRGQFLYKVRTGDYVNPALARNEARKLARQLDIDVIMTDLTGTGGQSGN